MTLNWTGERLETFVFNETTIEHLHRYAIAQEYASDKIILDLACGEGYGSALLSQVAKSVSGVDIDNETIQSAKNKYKSQNLEFLQGRGEKIPFADKSFDVVTCFETLEHTLHHEEFLNEFKRVLKEDGVLILSTPDRKNYSDQTGYKNPFHVKELYKEELTQLLARNFKYYHFLHQHLFLASFAISPSESRIKIYEGDYTKIESGNDLRPLYHIVLASDMPFKLPDSSIFRSNVVLQTAMNAQEQFIKSSLSYRIGHSLLSPFKWIRNQVNPKRSS